MLLKNGRWKVVEKQINNGRDDFLLPLKDLELKKRGCKRS